jgi:hypothetical protein
MASLLQKSQTRAYVKIRVGFPFFGALPSRVLNSLLCLSATEFQVRPGIQDRRSDG